MTDVLPESALQDHICAERLAARNVRLGQHERHAEVFRIGSGERFHLARRVPVKIDSHQLADGFEP